MGRAAVLVILLMLGSTVVWKLVTAIPSERTTLVLDGDPLQVISWDEARRRLTVIPLPADVRIDGAYGMGSLPITSIRTLETLDDTKKGVFVASLADALAIPITGTMKRASWPLRLRFWWITQRLRPDAVTTLDLASRGVFRTETLPDGSQVRVFDPNRYDAVVGSQLEVDGVRREERRVRIINTTDVTGLGNRAARLLSHAGMVVVAVDSERADQTACTMHAKEDLWSGQSATFIKDVLRCVLTAADTDERVDVTVRLGEANARR